MSTSDIISRSSSLPCNGAKPCQHSHPSSTPIAVFLPAFIVLSILLTFFLIHFFHETILDYVRHIIRRRLNVTSPKKANPGLDSVIVESFPIFLYGKDEKVQVGTECSICLTEYEEGDDVRLLTICCHAFHRYCIDHWLAQHVTCPVCRSDLTVPPKQRSETVESLCGWLEMEPLLNNKDYKIPQR